MTVRSPLELAFLEDEIPALDHVDLVTVRLPFVAPFGTSVYTWTVKEALLLRLEACGVEAWGECVADPDPYYFHETIATARSIIKDFLLPLVEPGLTLAALETRFARVRGNGMAKATVENALLSLNAILRGVPLHALLGRPSARIPSGISIGLKETPAALVTAVEAAVAKNYHRIKVKIEKGRDIEWIEAVRARFQRIKLMADANGDYTLDDVGHLRRLDAFDLMMIEQPLSYSDIYQYSILQKELRTPVCLDESIHSPAEAETAIALGACRVINIKQGRVGGLAAAMRIARLAADHGLDAWSGGMDETGIGRAVNIHLQTAEGFSLPGDTAETANYFAEDIAVPPVVLDPDGFIPIPPGPGIGIAVLPERLAKYAVGRERLR